jgi:hypothetical protein
LFQWNTQGRLFFSRPSIDLLTWNYQWSDLAVG